MEMLLRQGEGEEGVGFFAWGHLFLFFEVSRIAKGFPGGSDGRESAHNAGDLGSSPGLEDLLE